MIVSKSLIDGIEYRNVWYAQKPLMDRGVTVYHQAQYKGKGAAEFETLVTDLTEPPEEIKHHFASNCRNEISRAGKENITSQMNESVSDEDIDEFVTFFREFWASKGALNHCPETLSDEMKHYRDNGNLAISTAYVEGEKSVYHTYLVDDDIVRLWHSASLYRNINTDEKQGRKLVGFANRYLHYVDMLYFKDNGKKSYDWGGSGKTPEVINITKFKQSFGGIEQVDYEFKQIVGCSTYIKLVCRKLKNRICR